MTAGPFTLFIDGDCPLCKREAALMARMDRGRGGLRLVDIASPDFDAAAYGRSHAQFMAEIHGQEPGGELLIGMEAFRRAYASIGWGWLLAPTGWPILRPLFDRLYAFFARHRLSLTGRKCAPEAACRIEPR